jgi:hypothetical protein
VLVVRHGSILSATTLFWDGLTMRITRCAAHSITSSAVICMIKGIVTPSALAVLRLMTSSNLVGA